MSLVLQVPEDSNGPAVIWVCFFLVFSWPRSRSDACASSLLFLHPLWQDDLLSLKVVSVLHHLSIKRAIQVLRLNNFEPNCLRRRPSDEVTTLNANTSHGFFRMNVQECLLCSLFSYCHFSFMGTFPYSSESSLGPPLWQPMDHSPCPLLRKCLLRPSWTRMQCSSGHLVQPFLVWSHECER